ncbi:flagellar filament capping protein FliD [Roseospirillum parvum]|uniref:Flagellar hook-associated protein 2 n=1 Tax=Roseospirillum parvum TaxID=83401 RepID=A0A1G8AN99_9PROT|nr:flagellar filament capping protein FliD [Roseospirillum parvum]SDH22394.1 flagellar hook-associated protein 2 [Roseospirillum parvum]
MSSVVSVSTATGSSGTTYLSGLSGLETSALIEAAVESRMQKAYSLDSEIETAEAELAAYQDMLDLLGDLQDALVALGDDADEAVYGEAAAYLSSSAIAEPDDVLGVTVTDSAELGLYEIDIIQLAESQKVAAAEQTSSSDALGLAGVFELAADGHDGATITLTADMSLSDLASAINAASDDSGVSATLVRTSDSGVTLVLAGVDTGTEFTATATSGDDVLHGLGLTDTDGAFADVLQAAQMAQLSVDGVSVTSTSNDIEDLLPGVSVNLYAATEGDTLTLEVGQDLSALNDAVEAFVTAYNAYRDFALTQQTLSEDEDAGAADTAVLFANDLVKQVNSLLYEALASQVTVDGETWLLSDLGITLGSDNTLRIDTDTLEEALLQNPEVIQAFFQTSTETDSGDLGVYKNTSQLASGTYEVTVTLDADGTIASASLDGTELTVSGTVIKGAEGTTAEGLWLVYTGKASGTATLTVSQGLADALDDRLDAYTDATDGRLVERMASLEEAIEDKQDRRDRIAERAADTEADLIKTYARLEAEIAAADLMLQQLQTLLGTNQDD